MLRLGEGKVCEMRIMRVRVRVGLLVKRCWREGMALWRDCGVERGYSALRLGGFGG